MQTPPRPRAKAKIADLNERFRKRHLNLFARYFLVITLVIFICFAVLGCSLLLFVSNYWRAEKTSLLKENALQVASTTADLLDSGRLDKDGVGTVAILCNTLMLVSSAIEADVFICNLDGSVILCKDLFSPEMQVTNASACKIHDGMHFPADVVAKTIEKEYIRAGTLEGVYSDSHFIIGEPVMVDGEPAALVFATKPTSSGLGPYLWNIFKMFLFSALMALLLAFVAVYVLTYNLIRPLREMSAATKRYARGDFTYRVDSHGNGELSELAGALNSMAKALAILESSRRSFVANVSHELKTPMTTIGGFIDGILDGTIPPSQQKHYLEIVSAEIKRLSRLVMTMLNMSKIEAGELKLQPRKFDISAQMFQVFLLFEQSIERKKIEISGLEDMKSVTVEADPDMIHQVLYNLIDNAVKFTQEGGRISASVLSDAEKVIVRIRNTGLGISSEEISKIFERFYKVDKSRSFDVKGAGLGLYIVKSIIELHGGQITAKSDEGNYTEFVFWLPLQYGKLF